MQEVVILSDDEDDDASELQVVAIKTESIETSDNNVESGAGRSSDMIDLTDEAFEDTEVPRHYISWLSGLIQRAKINPTTMDQRLDAADISTDIIVIEDPEDNRDANKISMDETQETKVCQKQQQQQQSIHKVLQLLYTFINVADLNEWANVVAKNGCYLFKFMFNV